MYQASKEAHSGLFCTLKFKLIMQKNRKRKDRILLRKLITQLEANLCEELNNLNMKNTFVQADFKIQAFEMKRVIFDDSDLVSMEVRCRVSGELMNTTLLFTFSKFNDLLRFSGDSGEKLQLLVSDKLLSNEERPYIIESGEHRLIFTSCNLDLSYLIADDNTCFSADEITPITFLQQAKNLRNNIKDFNDVHINNNTQLNHSLQEIATMYRYYLGLIELNLNEQSAREKAGLVNDKLFKIAYHAALGGK